ncbi:hypothetical protein TanjilG_21245 [Lupinus angustifolius]|uniref:HXXXD-type acyl-transferase family protein n=1 Tax=Lupinus angustifolius TaxID=3871 RepID=A0A1J7HA25_LUPAN|nr:PREDICTED: uncharacterized acetyltransferase At3g50280-like [Lupinus angustifolius]OIW09719.1 hypothetical protein TanjilG_21245 [Lupinus angustifolius]
MEATRVISTTTIKAPSDNNNTNPTPKIHLTPWDLAFLPIEAIQKGLLFHNPNNEEKQDISIQIQHLKNTLSTTLSFFPLLTGRFDIIHNEHEDNKNASCYILCNNSGVLFVHAVAENTSVAHILESKYVPSIVHSFFPLNGVKNYEATSQPLLAIQVTELIDGIFIGCTLNHAAADGKSFWHFMNSWAEISRGNNKISKLPSFQRFFYDTTDQPIRFPFTKEDETYSENSSPLSERIFHFSKEEIVKLKSEANEEANTDKLSSLQALLSHVWKSVFRFKHVDPEEEIRYILIIGVRPRMVPQLEEDYFGNAGMICAVTMKAREVLESGVGKVALEMNKVISSYTGDNIKSQYEYWVRKPTFLSLVNVDSTNNLATSSSPRFNVYGNDFGWGKPVAVRSGSANKKNGKITVYEGAEKGSIDIELCLPYEILEALGNDPYFMNTIPRLKEKNSVQ